MDYTLKDTIYVKLGIIFTGLSATLIFEIKCSVEDDDLSSYNFIKDEMFHSGGA
jgi:hypothetical protein